MSIADFSAAYLEAAIWSSVPDGPEGDAWHAAPLSPQLTERMAADCSAFYLAHGEMIEEAGTAKQAGHDFWLTRCGHGAGFWDGDWPEPAATVLTDAAHAFGNVDLYLGDDGALYA